MNKKVGLFLMLINWTLADAKVEDEKQRFELADVEALALYFAEESVRKMRIPLTLRVVAAATGDKISKKDELERVRSKPPKANEKGVVYPFGENNPLSFVFNAEKGTLTVYERFIKKRGKIGFYGLTAVELAVELNNSSSRKKDRANADFAFDATSDALSLKREYSYLPSNKNKFYKEVDKMIKTQLKWTNSEKFIKAAKAASARYQPPESAIAENNGFKANLVLRHFSVYPGLTQLYTDRYVKTWDRKPSSYSPTLVSDNKFWLNQILSGFIHFQGAENNYDGIASVYAEFNLRGPDGKLIFENQNVQLWQFESPPQKHLQIGMNNISFSMDDESELGTYLVEARVCDQASQRCVNLSHEVELLSQ